MSQDKKFITSFITNLTVIQEREIAREGMVLLKRSKKRRGRPPKSIIDTVWEGDPEVQQLAWELENMKYETPSELAHCPPQSFMFCRDVIEAILFSPKGIYFPTFFVWNGKLTISPNQQPLKDLSLKVDCNTIISNGLWEVKGTIMRACIAKYFSAFVDRLSSRVEMSIPQENPYIVAIAPVVSQEVFQRYKLALRFLEHFVWGAYIKRT